MKKLIIKPELVWLMLALALAGGLWLVRISHQPAKVWPLTDLKPARTSTGSLVDPSEVTAGGEIVIHVAGAVKNPGVYRLAESARLVDALKAAGGPLSYADVGSINLAQPLQDGQKIAVAERTPIKVLAGLEQAQGNPGPGTASGHSSKSVPGNLNGKNQGKININNSTLEQLETLPGIGPKLARNIFEYRQANGPFTQWEDLRNVQGIGEKRLTKIQEAATLN